MSCPTCCPRVDCNDPYSIFIQAILNLGEASGSDATAVSAEALNVCANADYTVEESQAILLSGMRRGIFGRGSPTTFMVQSNMAQLDGRNAKYYRGPGCPNSFYRC
jgi:hypothetical protein